MTDGNCFISYSATDGLEFATKLADELQGRHPFFKTWFDKRELSSTSPDDWDDQLANAIKACKCLVFVMTPDSTSKGSTCKAEWTWALKYKKPVICLLKDKKAEVPFRLFNRQYIDISTDFDAGIAQLRSAIKRLDEPEGILEELDRRLSQAKRDLQRTPHEEEKPRIQAEIDDLNKQIEAQQKFVNNPKGAEEQTKKNIEAGLERERQPDKPLSKKISTKFINPPPGIAPNYYQDREVETKMTLDFLNDDSQRMMTIVGRGGVGKTAMVCRLLKGLEGGELPDRLGSMKVEGIVYLSESGSHRVNFANLFYDLRKLLPAEAANALDAVYKNPQVSTASKMSALLDGFTTGKVVLLLDNVEPLISVETFDIADAELDECLRALLHGAHSALKVILTTRVAPRGLNLCEPGRQRVLTLDSGLEQKYAVEMLREMDVDGKLGLKSADAEALKRAYERTLGFPRALEALFAILASDRYTTLEELLAMPTPENVVEALVGEAFNRLDTNAQKVMQALAVYNHPVTPAAVDYLLAPHIPAMDSAPILQRLANMHFARKESGRFYLHPVDREFAFSLTPAPLPAGEGEGVRESGGFNQHDLTSRAADYFAQARKPRAEWKKLEDLSAQLAEFDLRCAAGDYDTGASVLNQINFDYLLLWGHARLMIDLNLRVKHRIAEARMQENILNALGSAHQHIGKVDESITLFEEGLKIARNTKNRDGESVFLGNLGSSFAILGNAHRSVENFKDSIVIQRELGNRRGEGTSLHWLGVGSATLGQIEDALSYYHQALEIEREIEDRSGEAWTLGNIGVCLGDLGEISQAIEYYEKALIIQSELGNRRGEGVLLGNIAEQRINLGEYAKAIQAAEQYARICVEINKPASYALSRLALAYLHDSELKKAREYIESALQSDEPGNNHNVSTLHGIIALRQGDEVVARGAFVRAIGQADEILSKTAEYYSALDAKGIAICGLILAGRGDPSMPTETNDGKTVPPDKYTVSDGRVAPTVDDAIETFRKARKIAPHAGVVKSVLRLFDELAKCDEDGVLKDVRKAVEGS